MLRRLVPATAASALLLTVGLTGCSAQPATTTAVDCSPVLRPGAVTDNITVSGAVGEVPEVKLTPGLQVTQQQGQTLVRASDRGTIAEPGSLVGVNYAIYSAATGEMVQATPGFTDPGAQPSYTIAADSGQDIVGMAVNCAAPGDRVALALPGQAGAEDALVGVVDVATVGPMYAQGRTHGLPSGFPAVVTNEAGQPGIVLPPGDAPKQTVTASRIVGDGAKVTAEDNVIGQVLSVGWDGTERLNSHTDQQVGYVYGTEADIAQSGYGWRAQLTGKTVGSQVVILDENNGDPQVVVVDILGVG